MAKRYDLVIGRGSGARLLVRDEEGAGRERNDEKGSDGSVNSFEKEIGKA